MYVYRCKCGTTATLTPSLLTASNPQRLLVLVVNEACSPVVTSTGEMKLLDCQLRMNEYLDKNQSIPFFLNEMHYGQCQWS